MILNLNLSHVGSLNLRKLLTFLELQLSHHQMGIVLTTLRDANSNSIIIYAKGMAWVYTLGKIKILLDFE